MVNSLPELEKLSTELARLLIKEDWTVALAESCTGGWIAKTLTDLPGSSRWFELGVVTYSNSAKQKILNVPGSMLASHGAVSEPVAEAMVKGVIELTEANIGVSVTGIAGPGGGSGRKPVGTVCFGFSHFFKGLRVETQRFSGQRENVRYQAVIYALHGLLADLTE